MRIQVKGSNLHLNSWLTARVL